MTTPMQQAYQVLNSTFGYSHFRGHQEAVMEDVLAGRDALVVMPTGGGKSLCYQIPALIRRGTGIVISPLIALMQNQVGRLRELGVRADYLNSSLTSAAAAAVQKRLRDGDLDLLYVAPERLLMEGTIALLHKVPLALFAIDEAHCISQWGHDFRKDYLGLALLAAEFPEVPRMALTATADERTRAEIVARLKLKLSRSFVSSFDRPNIRYSIGEKHRPKEQLLSFIEAEHDQDAGIVYALTRKDVDETAAWLAARGKNALAYHAGLRADERQRTLDTFLREDGVIVVATIAFGMGIDKPDVRFVAHLDLPKNLEAYYQETGRAGRDGAPANAWMIYGVRDVIMLRQMLNSSDGAAAFKQLERQKIQAILAFCENPGCRRQTLLRYFGEELSTPCGNCDRCLAPPLMWDATRPAQMALSCIYRTGQRFGVGHLIDVLLGRDAPRIKELSHDRVSTFGIGRDHSEGVWRCVYRALIANGLVVVDDYGALHLDPTANPLLKGEATLPMCEITQAPGRSKRRDVKAPRAKPPAVTSSLRTALVQHRLVLARQQNLPPYCIFHNTTLDAMAAAQPRSVAEFSAMPGVGAVKLAKYGESFLQIIRQHHQP